MKNILIASLSFFFLVLGCKKSTTTLNMPTTPTAPTSNFFFKATIDGKTVDLNDLDPRFGSGAGYSSTTSNQHEQSLQIVNTLGQQPAGGVIIAKTFANSLEKCSEIESMFNVKSYSAANTVSGVDGAAVYYVDDQGTYWSTSYDSTTTQPNWSFAITSHTALTNDSFAKYLTEATFSCTLYDRNGNTKTLTNGSIKSRSVQCIDLP